MMLIVTNSNIPQFVLCQGFLIFLTCLIEFVNTGWAVMVVIVWWLDLLPVQSVPITTKVVSSNSIHGEIYSIQHYVIKLVSDLRQVGGFLRFPPPIKLTATI